MSDGKDVRTTARAQGLVLTTSTTTLSLSVCGVDADDDREWNWVSVYFCLATRKLEVK